MATKGFSESNRAWRRFRRNKLAMSGLVFIVLATLVALGGYLLAPDSSPDANHQIPEIALQKPGFSATFALVPLHKDEPKTSFFQKIWQGSPLDYRLEPISQATTNSPDGKTLTKTFWLGTDKYGRCILSRLILGFRVSLLVGLIAVVISLVIGIFMGLLGGYFGGRTDDLIVLLINTVWSIPTLLLVFAIVLALGRGVGIIFLAVGLTMWVEVARVVRGQVLSLRDRAFVESARSMGFGTARILWRHVLPNLLGPIMVVAAGNFATAILLESGLSYLGFGVPPPTPSWGSMLNEHYGYALGGKPILAFIPAFAIMCTVLAFNLVGNGLRDALDNG